MTWFLFAGDMLVMLFMALVAVWVFWRSSDSAVDRAGRIPLEDEAGAPAETGDQPRPPDAEAG